MGVHRLFATIVILMCVAPVASSKIVFTSNMDGNYEIYVMDDDGTNVQRLTDHPDKDVGPRWSPNGKQIVFDREKRWQPGQKQQQIDIFVMNRDGSQPQQITDHPGMHIQPHWSSDGKQIAFCSSRSGEWNIHKIDIKSREVKQLTQNLKQGTISMQDWSPDGKSIAYTAPSPPKLNTIYITDANGSTHRQFLPGKGTFRYSFQWSSDNTKILYCDAAYQGNHLISNNIIIRSKNGHLLHNLDMTGKRFVHSVRWMGDRRYLLITSEPWSPPRLPTEIYRYTLATGKLTNLTNFPSREQLGDWIDDDALGVLPAGKLSILWGQLKKQ